MRRDRLCIPVRLGRQGELPKGSLTLATSASGAQRWFCWQLQRRPGRLRSRPLCLGGLLLPLTQTCHTQVLAACNTHAFACTHLIAHPAGSTLYMEPEPVVALNNREMALAGEEAEEEAAVLTALSRLVGGMPKPYWRTCTARRWASGCESSMARSTGQVNCVPST